MRYLFGTLAGIVVAILIMIGIEQIDAALYPWPTNIDPDDYDAVARIIPSMPMPAKLIVVSAWLLGAFGGGWLALRITDWRWSATVVTIFVIVAGVVNFIALPHPFWMRVCAVVLPIIGGWMAGRFHRRPYPGEALLG